MDTTRKQCVDAYQLLHVLQNFGSGWCIVIIVETNVGKVSRQLCLLAREGRQKIGDFFCENDDEFG